MLNRYININSLLRLYCGLNYTYNRTAIEIIDGNSEPKCCGVKSFYTNRSGELVMHPNAYRKAFGKPIYHKSTRKIQVGRKWLDWLKLTVETYNFATEMVKNTLEIK